jgi:acetylornithine deacetylase/succinyl-diaminopimelate desuccinylase-like protein
VFGPGSIELAHRPNESIGLEELEQGGAIVERLVTRFCQ